MTAVLVVDDEVAMRRLMTRWVEMAGHHAASAASADEALDVLSHQPLAVALCDVRMPGHDGLWLAERIRRDYPDTAVIMATAARDSDPRLAEHRGAVDYLLKPFGRDRLRFALERGFDWHQLAASRREWVQQLSAEMAVRQSELTVRLAELADDQLNIDALLDLIGSVDPRALAHARRVAELSLAMGRALGLVDEDLQLVRTAALLHDFGKLAVPQAILGKPAALSLDEKEIVRKHLTIGVDLLQSLQGLQDACAIIGSAKEWYDGCGYPHALAGDAIPLGGRIVAVADAFDAMTRAQIYRDAMPGSEALREILCCANTQFDPLVVSSLLKIIGENGGE